MKDLKETKLQVMELGRSNRDTMIQMEEMQATSLQEIEHQNSTIASLKTQNEQQAQQIKTLQTHLINQSSKDDDSVSFFSVIFLAPRKPQELYLELTGSRTADCINLSYECRVVLILELRRTKGITDKMNLGFP